jgi:hypothetical protein
LNGSALEGHATRRLSNRLIARLGSRDARAVKPAEYVALLDVLEEVFLPCAVPLGFAFLPANVVPLGDCTVQTVVCDAGWSARRARIRIHPVRHGGMCGDLPARFRVVNAASVNRLGTLLHEICHAFLDLYACSECSRAEVSQFRGHGFAWQRVAYWVQAYAREKLDLPLELGRFDSIAVHWGDMEILPSMEEMMRCGLDE